MSFSAYATAFCFSTASTLPYRVIAYYPYRKQLRFPVWVIVLLVGISQLVQSSLYAWLSANGGGGTRLQEFIFAPVCFIIFLASIQADRWKVLFLYIFIFDYTTLVRGAAMHLESLLFYSPELTFTSLRSVGIQLIFLAVTAPVMILFLKATKDKVFQTEAPAFWRVIWMLPAFTTVVVMLYTNDLSPESVRQFRFLFSRVLLLFGMIAVYYVLILALDTIRHEATLEEKAAQQENLLALQRTQYSQISRYMDETRQARHDLAQHLRIIHQYLSTGSQEDLRAYVEHYESTLPPNTTQTFCKNYAVNTVLSYYCEEAQTFGIDFTADLNLPEPLPISEPEFCSMIGNLLENALLACRTAGESAMAAPFIRVLARPDGDFLWLAIDNTYLSEPIQKDGRFLSSRHEGFGLGTASVATIAKRSGGSCEFTYENEVFYASVSLKLNNNQHIHGTES
ncbi:MAG: GHKL domain-containing protein [Lachnospiraceae bacterium]|nr:GHKL domain-containing protein [Lachnospiraceae bacterium]